ncbi:unnamed protein product [Leptidea sinapis]|uniref:FLYWCH-type domain-containing protein n=1 Tax=Leptidea sinapis TaxID=189913 RepID=A0A5E4PZZ6_9NEOP|nr:unnamed protein product [Leptidea sinapis]
MGPVLIKASKNKYILLFKSYTFRRCTKSKKGVVWKCTNSKSDGCKAILTTEDLNVVIEKGDHNHTKPKVESKKHVYFIIVVTMSSGNKFLVINGHTFRKEVSVNGATKTLIQTDDDIILFMESTKGMTVMQYDGFHYRQSMVLTEFGERWDCATNKLCTACVYLNENDEILATTAIHNHRSIETEESNREQ